MLKRSLNFNLWQAATQKQNPNFSYICPTIKNYYYVWNGGSELIFILD